jgi:hypothetical protein
MCFFGHGTDADYYYQVTSDRSRFVVCILFGMRFFGQGTDADYYYRGNQQPLSTFVFYMNISDYCLQYVQFLESSVTTLILLPDFLYSTKNSDESNWTLDMWKQTYRATRESGTEKFTELTSMRKRREEKESC